MTADIDIKRIYQSIQKFSTLSVLVIGDLILDEYIYGDVERVSPEAPVQVVDIKHKSNTLGGAANVAYNLINLGVKVYVSGIIGDDNNGNILKNELKKQNINFEGVFIDPLRPTTKKTRIIASGQHILRLDYELRKPISLHTEKLIIQYIIDNSLKFDSVIISDYAKGVVTNNIISSLVDTLKGKPIFVDPKGKDFTKYKGATAITPNKKEAFTASGAVNLNKAANKFIKELGLQTVFITLGKDGIFLMEKNGKSAYIPAVTKEVYDVSGAGDTVISILCASVSSGLSYYESAFLANIAAGIVVGKLGTAAVSKDELINTLFFEKSLILHKILKISELIQTVGHLKSQGKKIVFTNGCFDIIHPGHIHFLKESKKLGDILIVAIDDDQSVKNAKGKERPILNQYERAQIISSLDCVDYVIISPIQELPEIIEKIKPNILTKGEDHKDKKIIGGNIVEKYGGDITFISFANSNSSSQIIDKIIGNKM